MTILPNIVSNQTFAILNDAISVFRFQFSVIYKFFIIFAIMSLFFVTISCIILCPYHNLPMAATELCSYNYDLFSADVLLRVFRVFVLLRSEFCSEDHLLQFSYTL